MDALDRLWDDLRRATPLISDRASFRFDGAYYARSLPEALKGFETPEEHYARVGRSRGLPPTLYRQIVTENPAIHGVLLSLVSNQQVLAAMMEGKEEAFELAFEAIHAGGGAEARLSGFSAAHYLACNPDIRRARLDPLVHYLVHGAQEGRSTRVEMEKRQFFGTRKHDPARPTCLIGMQTPGPPGSVALELARQAAASHNVIILCYRSVGLPEEAQEWCSEILISDRPQDELDHFTGDPLGRVDFAILTSCETHTLIRPLVARRIPFLHYVTECTQHVEPVHKALFAALFADRLAFASRYHLDNWRPMLRDIEFDIEAESAVIPPDMPNVHLPDAGTRARARLSRILRIELADRKIVGGFGFVSMGTGADLFATTARLVRETGDDAIFLWMGDGPEPNDLRVGAWLDDHLRQAGMGASDGNLFIIPESDARIDLLQAADIVFASDRANPPVDLVREALRQAGRVLMFENCSGFQESPWSQGTAISFVPYADTVMAAQAIRTLPRKAEPPLAPAAEPEDSLFGSLAKMLAPVLLQPKDAGTIEGAFDIPVMFSTHPEEAPLRRLEQDKLFRFRRRLIWRDIAEAEAALRGSPLSVHASSLIVPYATARPNEIPDFSVHMHAFYIDELYRDIASYGLLQKASRLVVTTDTPVKAERVGRMLKELPVPSEVIVLANKGRDVLPFLILAERGIVRDDDELWCHLHQKKSVNAERDGNIWRRFMMRILLGDQLEMSAAVCAIATPSIGLVAPFDPYCIGWTGARALLPEISSKLLEPPLDNPLLFPVGNMFWIRGSVIRDMFGLFGEDYPWPNEPIPTDGSVYHLIERLWPTKAAERGLRSIFMYKEDEQRI